MPKKKYIVALTDSERDDLLKLTRKGKTAAYKINHALILLKADINQEGGGWTDKQISEALNRQCLNCRIPDQDTLKLEIAAWEQERNQNSHSVNWQFTTDDARIKLKRLYPSIQS